MASRNMQNWLRFSEFPRASVELASLAATAPWLGLAPRGTPHPVVVIPGFLASDDSTGILRRYLSFLGYDVYPWGQGRNLGAARMGGYEPLVSHVLKIYRQSGMKVSLVGWSLGGVHALAVADRAGYALRQVVAMGSPISQSGETTATFDALRSAARQLNGQIISTPQSAYFGMGHPLMRISPKLPVSAIYSKSDGVVPWQRARIEPTPVRENIEVYSSHIGLGVNPAVLYAVADRLAHAEGDFNHFHRDGWRALTYPSPVAAPNSSN